MPGVAVTLAGVPGRISASVVAALRQRFSDGYVFRAPGAKLHGDRLARYDANVVDAIVDGARDAVFGTTKRPNSFCRNTERPCALRDGGKHTCGRTEDQTCALSRPEYCVVLYHEGHDERVLLERLHHCAYTARLPRAAYDRLERTVAAVAEALRVATSDLPRLKQEMQSTMSPLLLPPRNFGAGDIDKLLVDALDPGSRTGAIKRFRTERYRREARSYEGRNGLGFKPAAPEIQHGRAGPQVRADLALSRHFRLGCPYPDDFHYDVSRLDGCDLGGKINIHCRDAGPSRPRGRNVNVLVDDCVRP